MHFRSVFTPLWRWTWTGNPLSEYHFRKHESYRLARVSAGAGRGTQEDNSLTSLHSGASDADIFQLELQFLCVFDRWKRDGDDAGGY
jgi:hypothetical protein